MASVDIYKKAGLVMKPAAIKDGKLYSQQPHSGSGDFTFSRANGAQTRINKYGLIENVADNEPRLSYDLVDGVVSDCPSLLLEPSRTNLLQRSEEFDNSYWTKARASLTANETTSPDGSNTADKLTDSTDNNTHIVYRSLTVSTSNDYTFSCFLKKGSLTKAFLAFDSTDAASVVFDLENGIVFSEGASVDDSSITQLPNDWYKCTLTHQPTTTTRLYRVGTYNGSVSYTGTGADFVYIWGAQIEEGSYATSYIPTSASTAVRQADICNGAGTSAEFNDSEGVLFLEFQGLTDTDADNGYVSISDGTATNSVMINTRTSGSLRLYNGGVGSTNLIYIETVDYSNTLKIALQYVTTTGSYKVYINGISKTISGTFSATAISGLDELKFQYAAGGNNFYGNTKQLMTFKTALTDSELEQITSWTSFNEMAKGQLYTIE